MGKSDKTLLDSPDIGNPMIAYYNPQYGRTIDFRAPPSQQGAVEDIYDVVEAPQRVPLEPPAAKPEPRNSKRSVCSRMLWVLPLFYTQFWVAAASAVAMHFFPALATSKAVEDWKVVYVSTALVGTALIGSVISERLMACMTPAKVFICSHAGIILCTFIFGCLYWSPGDDTITGIAIGAAAISGIVLALYLVSMYTLTTEWSKASAAITTAVMLCVWRAGYVAGPVIGNVLVKQWQYPLPFFICGGILLLSFLVIAIRGPVPPEQERSAIYTLDKVLYSDVQYRRVFLDSVFLIDMVTALISAMILTFNHHTLRAHLQTYTLTNMDLETTFTVQLACYGIGALTVGVFSYFGKEETCLLFGQTLAVVAYLFVGPVPFVQLESSQGQVILCQVCIGLSTSAMFVASFSHAIERLYELEYPETTRTTGFVSSVFFTSLSIGVISTPPLARHLVDTFGYRVGSTSLLGILALWWLVIFVLWMSSVCPCGKGGRRGKRNAAGEMESQFSVA